MVSVAEVDEDEFKVRSEVRASDLVRHLELLIKRFGDLPVEMQVKGVPTEKIYEIVPVYDVGDDPDSFVIASIGALG